MIRLVVSRKVKSFKVILEDKMVIKIMQIQDISAKFNYIGDKQLWKTGSDLQCMCQVNVSI